MNSASTSAHCTHTPMHTCVHMHTHTTHIPIAYQTTFTSRVIDILSEWGSLYVLLKDGRVSLGGGGMERRGKRDGERGGGRGKGEWGESKRSLRGEEGGGKVGREGGRREGELNSVSFYLSTKG